MYCVALYASRFEHALRGIDNASSGRRYGDLDPTFDQSWFGSLLVSLKQAVQEADVEAFNKQVRTEPSSVDSLGSDPGPHTREHQN